MNDFSPRERKLFFVIGIFFLIIIGLASGKLFETREDEVKMVADFTLEDNESTAKSNSEQSDNSIIMIHISGAVNNPGLISLESGSRLIDAVNAAGGAMAEADLDQVNLSRKINDEERIHIPLKGEISQIAPLSGEVSGGGVSPNTGENAEKININTSDKSSLMELPGIGEKTADKIINYRQENPFKSIDDLKEVPGIGEKKFNELKDKISV